MTKIRGEPLMGAGIFGVGNELREDDGIGIVIVEKLRELFTGDSVDLLVVGERLLEIPLLMPDYSKIAIIDALPPATEPGKITTVHYGGNHFAFPNGYSLHDLDLLWQLQSGFCIGYQGEILLIGVEAGALAYKEGLSSKLYRSLPAITLTVSKVIIEFLGLTN